MGKTNINFQKDLKLFRKTLQFVWDSSKHLTIIRLGLIVFQAILPLIPLYLIKLLIDQIAEDGSDGLQNSWWILILFGVIQLLIIIIENYSNYVSNVQADKVSDHMSSVVIQKSIDLDLEHYDSDRYHDTYHRAQLQAGHRPLSLLNAITQLFRNLLMLVALAGLLATLHWAVGLVMLLMVIPIVYVQLKYTRIIFKWKEKTTPLERRSNYIRRVLSTISFAKEVRLFGYGSILKERFNSIRKNLLDEKKQLYISQNLSLSSVQIIEAAATIGVLAFILLRALNGIISIGDVVMYFQAFQKGQTSIHRCLSSGVSLYENRLFLKHIFRFLNLKSKISDPKEFQTTINKISQINLEDISFTYPENSNEVLSNVNLNFESGKIYALVGENGSGKTTLVKILNRLYEPSKGLVKANGQDIRKIDLANLRSKMTVIFQDFSKYDFTVKENIHISNMSEEMDIERIKESTRLTGAADFVNKFKDTYDTQLGRSFRKGQELSSGQWQKIALSRAFYKNSDVIVLDEPTSFIDPLAEADIFSKLRAIGKDKIMVLVTHRIYNLKTADEIVVMDEGRVIEKGSHEELMNKGGKYFEMFSAQN